MQASVVHVSHSASRTPTPPRPSLCSAPLFPVTALPLTVRSVAFRRLTKLCTDDTRLLHDLLCICNDLLRHGCGFDGGAGRGGHGE